MVFVYIYLAIALVFATYLAHDLGTKRWTWGDWVALPVISIFWIFVLAIGLWELGKERFK